jgi:uroporphyrinogen III methyltransferase/synthase
MSGHPRGRKAKPGRITFVGSGPGDPGLLTTRARTVLANASCVFTDPDVGEAVLRLVGTDLPPAVGPAPEGASARGGDQTAPPVVQVGPDIRPALGEPADVAKTLIAEAKAGADASSPVPRQAGQTTMGNSGRATAPLPPQLVQVMVLTAPVPRQ